MCGRHSHPSQDVAADFAQRKADVIEALDRLNTMIAREFNVEPGAADWGHVAILGSIADRLRRIAA